MTGNIKDAMNQYVKEYEQKDQLREQHILAARTIQKAAKQAIYALHRADTQGAEELFAKAEEVLRKETQASSVKQVLEQGAMRAAYEELLEGKAFAHILTTWQLPTKEQLAPAELPTELYLQALCDTSGELVRFAVQQATKNAKEKVHQIKDLIEELQGYFLLFDFRNSELRKKSDSLRHNLSKVETILYEVSLRS